jgi:hypothetical protein
MTGGFVCIFSSKNWQWTGPIVGGGEKNFRAGALHSLTGLICTILAWSQVLIAFMRCAPTSALRPLFVWVHRSIGIAALTLAGSLVASLFDHLKLTLFLIFCRHYYKPNFYSWVVLGWQLSSDPLTQGSCPTLRARSPRKLYCLS